MSQYNQIPLQNTCDLSQSGNLGSSNLVKLLEYPLFVAASTFSPVVPIKKLMQYQSPRDTITLGVAQAYLDESIKESKGLLLNDPYRLTPINVDAITLPTLRHISNICDTKNTITLDDKVLTKKSQIYDETPCYSHFEPNEKIIPLPIHIRSFDVHCKSDYVLSERTAQVAQFNRVTGRVKEHLQSTHKFFDTQKIYVPDPLKVNPIPSPPPSPCGAGGGLVGIDMSNAQGQANPLTNDAYFTAANTNTVLDAKLTRVQKLDYLTEKLYQESLGDLSEQLSPDSDRIVNPNPLTPEMLNRNPRLKFLQGLFGSSDCKKEAVLKDRQLLQHGYSPDRLKLQMRSYPAYVEMKLSDLNYDQSQRYKNVTPDNSVVGTRGAITEFSADSLRRLQLETANYQALGYKAEFMLTLTVGDDFKGITGKKFKKYLDNFGKALARYMKQVGVPDYKGLWFLEFQRRGAPHYHIMLWDMGDMTPPQCRNFSKWARVTWARIVGHQDPNDYAKHLKRGARFEKMRHDDFRYARAYASKKYQKIVPESYGSVGRFWGRFNHGKIQPVVITQEVSDQMTAAIKEMVLLAYRDISHKVARRVHRGLIDRFEDTSYIKHFAHRLYRPEVVQWFFEVMDILGVHAGETIPDDALSRADEITEKYFWSDDWGEWLQLHRGVLIGKLYN